MKTTRMLAMTTGLLLLGGSMAGAQAPKAAGDMNRHTMEGQVTKVDAKKGWIDVKTSEGSMKLHFPPGTSNNLVTNSFTLPVAADLLAVLPHAHNLAREIQGYATLPNGKKEWLILIKDWDFRWQGDYRYVEPLKFPAGTNDHEIVSCGWAAMLAWPELDL